MDPKDWTKENLEVWLSSPLIQERKDFDLKAIIPNNPEGKFDLKRDFCGFANGCGGFLFFGVENNKTITGVDEDLEFTTKISEIVSKHIYPPTIDWSLYECIKMVESNKCVYVIKISESPYWQKPHSFYEQNQGLCIPIRENGNKRRVVDGAEIRRMFFKSDGYYPEYNIHIFSILTELKNKVVPSFSLIEMTIIQGYKNFLRLSSDAQASEIVADLEKIERAVGAYKTISSRIMDGSVINDDSERKNTTDLVDGFISRFKIIS